jgi:hypothetical protein
MKADILDDITIVPVITIDAVESTSWIVNSEWIIVNYWLVLFSGNFAYLKDENLNRLPVIEY